MNPYNDTSWILNYLGKPFQACAHGPDAYDCWGLLRDVYKNIFNIHIPYITIPPQHQRSKRIASAAQSQPWAPSPQPQHAHVALFTKPQKNKKIPEHIGIILIPNSVPLILHAVFPQGVVCEPLERISSSRGLSVYGFFHHSSQASS